MSPTRVATRDVELQLCSLHTTVAGMDEVGRGALAGPVAVGVCVVDATCGPPPQGLTDSKRLTPRRREAMCAPVQQWVLTSAVGWASPAEVDARGIITALRLAGLRALGAVRAGGVHPGVVLLDGSHDWLTPPEQDLFTAGDCAGPGVPVVTRVRADLECAVVSAASVLAKVSRDARMCELPDPGYDWAHNKGYASPSHVRGLSRLGPCELHRRTWHLPGVTAGDGASASGAPMGPSVLGEGMMGL